MAPFGVVVYLFIGYLVGAMCSEHIFMDFSLTHWDNAWTWGWILLWKVFLICYVIYHTFVYILAFVGAVIVVSFVVNLHYNRTSL